jgi:hypothetical protein
VAQQSLVGQGLLRMEASRSHSDTPHSVGLLWTSDQPDAETSTWPHNTHKRQTSMRRAGFEPTIPARKRSQAHPLDGAATGIGETKLITANYTILPLHKSHCCDIVQIVLTSVCLEHWLTPHCLARARI